jgi:uncharacterized pyridoxamine 5'-phosphate oxidase family protein
MLYKLAQSPALKITQLYFPTRNNKNYFKLSQKSCNITLVRKTTSSVSQMRTEFLQGSKRHLLLLFTFLNDVQLG